MVRKVLKYPNPGLRAKSGVVTEKYLPRLRKLVFDLQDTMKANGGVGIAAPQVGVTKRVVIITAKSGDSHSTPRPFCMVNPVIESAYDPVDNIEGCLSVPGQSCPTKRFKQVLVRFQNQDLVEKRAVLLDTEAFIIQHEIDHLDGRLILDHGVDDSGKGRTGEDGSVHPGDSGESAVPQEGVRGDTPEPVQADSSGTQTVPRADSGTTEEASG